MGSTLSMATLDYIDVPPGATRLRSSSTEDAADIQPAQEIRTTLPNPSPSPESHRRASPASPTNLFASQMMASLPAMLMGPIPLSPPPGAAAPPTPAAAAAPPPTNPRKKIEPAKVTLLSSRDPLSLPILTNNFKRFVGKVGPVFWLQDRIEEILFWKKSWSATMMWMALYAFLCYFPRVILLVPHAALIAIILATYPYASDATEETPAIPTQPAEGTVVWQANIQAIQNLMGFVADMSTLITPYTYHLCLSRTHLGQSTDNLSTHPSPATHSPYTPHILTILVVTFFPLLFAVHLPSFPVREVFLFIGLAPFMLTHPYTRLVARLTFAYAKEHAPLLIRRYRRLVERVSPKIASFLDMPFRTALERVMDNDQLTDECWGAELREVELFENERYEGPVPPTESTGQGWSKQHLKPGERCAWTRGRDGWTGVGPDGEVSSNLTFSLGPGWRFVETEDWRRDLQAEWAECGGDEEGWVYTNDSWLGPRPAAYTAGGGSVTRRRRWVRRVWYDSIPPGR